MRWFEYKIVDLQHKIVILDKLLTINVNTINCVQGWGLVGAWGSQRCGF